MTCRTSTVIQEINNFVFTSDLIIESRLCK